jgi:hypothetical protein
MKTIHGQTYKDIFARVLFYVIKCEILIDITFHEGTLIPLSPYFIKI